MTGPILAGYLQVGVEVVMHIREHLTAVTPTSLDCGRERTHRVVGSYRRGAIAPLLPVHPPKPKVGNA